MQNYLVVNSSVSENEFRDMGPCKWTKEGFNTLEEATEADMVEVIV